ncbi:hypothetical protein M8J76_010395 [Diaphorina citri]|nr:hypothetical protein M8J76_010395 [Diaphorina citri]
MDSLNNTIDYFSSNITEDVTLIQDLEEIGLTELETVIIACLATAVPLLLIFGLGLLLKLCIDRCMKRKAERYQGYLTRDDSRLRETDDEMKTSESQFSVIPPEEISEVVGAYGFSGSLGGGPSRPNGSIITINMKNNHLIVETEEPVSGILKPQTTLSPFSYATSTSSRNTLLSNTSGGTTYMVDIVEEQDTEQDDLLDINGPFMSNQEYYKYNKSKYEASQCRAQDSHEGFSIDTADVNTTCVELTHHNHEHRKMTLKDFQNSLYEKKVEDVFKRSLSDSVDNEEVVSVDILDSKNEALNYQKILNDNQMFLKDIKSLHNGHTEKNIQQNPQSNNCDIRTPSSCDTVHGSQNGHNMELSVCDPSSMNYTRAHFRKEIPADSSPGIYDFACNCKIPHTAPTQAFDEDSININIPDVVQHNNELSNLGPMSSQCILENYQNMYNDIRLGQVTSGFSQCDAVCCENEYYKYGNQREYCITDLIARKPRLPEEFVHLQMQKRLGNGSKTPPD